MTAHLASSPDIPTLADLLDRLGGVSAERVRYYPLPGTATVDDVVNIEQRENRLCELIDGVLVEKPMGYEESLLAMLVVTALNNFVLPRDLGLVTGEAGMLRLFPGLVRIPDVAFVSRQRLPGGAVRLGPVPQLTPDLVVEVLSHSNTLAEMARKRREYFEAGVRLLWEIDPPARTVNVYTTAETFQTLHETDILEGEPVLPGFHLALKGVFAKLDR